MRIINYLITVYSITFWGLYYWLVHSFLFFECIIDNVCGCLSFELAMMSHAIWVTLVMREFTTHLSWTPNRKPRFFLQNLPKPTDRKHFETVTTLMSCFILIYLDELGVIPRSWSSIDVIKMWRSTVSHSGLLWPPYVIGGPLYFCPVVSFYLSIYLSSSFFSSPNLIGHRLDVYHTSTHGVALVRI